MKIRRWPSLPPVWMCPKHPQCAPGNVAAFQLSSAGLHGPDGDRDSIVFKKVKKREDANVDNVEWILVFHCHLLDRLVNHCPYINIYF